MTRARSLENNAETTLVGGIIDLSFRSMLVRLAKSNQDTFSWDMDV